MLSSQVVHNGLSPADKLILGMVKVWGAGSTMIREATITISDGTTHPLTPQHNVETQVRKVLDAHHLKYPENRTPQLQLLLWG